MAGLPAASAPPPGYQRGVREPYKEYKTSGRAVGPLASMVRCCSLLCFKFISLSLLSYFQLHVRCPPGGGCFGGLVELCPSVAVVSSGGFLAGGSLGRFSVALFFFQVLAGGLGSSMFSLPTSLGLTLTFLFQASDEPFLHPRSTLKNHSR